MRRSRARALKLVNNLAKRYPEDDNMDAFDPKHKRQMSTPIKQIDPDYDIDHDRLGRKFHTRRVATHKIMSPQYSVSPAEIKDKIKKKQPKDYLPLATKHGRNYVVDNGNHRVAAAKAQGKKWIRMRVMNPTFNKEK